MSHGIKIVRINAIRITQIYQFTLILYGVWVRPLW